MKKLLFVALLFPSVLFAAPHVVSDPSTNLQVTHCAWYLDSTPKQVVAAPKDAAGKPYCKLDVASVTPGAHTIKAAFVIDDPIWGVQEGPQSDPLDFSRPAAPSKPFGLKVVP